MLRVLRWRAPRVDVGDSWRSRPSAPPFPRAAHLHDEAAELQAADEAVVVGVHHVLVGDGHVVLGGHVVSQVVVHDQAQQPGGRGRDQESVCGWRAYKVADGEERGGPHDPLGNLFSSSRAPQQPAYGVVVAPVRRRRRCCRAPAAARPRPAAPVEQREVDLLKHLLKGRLHHDHALALLGLPDVGQVVDALGVVMVFGGGAGAGGRGWVGGGRVGFQTRTKQRAGKRSAARVTRAESKGAAPCRRGGAPTAAAASKQAAPPPTKQGAPGTTCTPAAAAAPSPRA